METRGIDTAAILVAVTGAGGGAGEPEVPVARTTLPSINVVVIAIVGAIAAHATARQPDP